MTKPIDDAMREQSAELRRQVNADRPTREDLRKLRAQMKGDPSTSIRYLAAPMLLERLEAALAERDAARAAGFAEAKAKLKVAARVAEMAADTHEHLQAFHALCDAIDTLSPGDVVVVPRETLERVRDWLRKCRLPPAFMGQPETYIAHVDVRGWNESNDAALAALEGLLK